jgi:hypothetical protein
MWHLLVPGSLPASKVANFLTSARHPPFRITYTVREQGVSLLEGQGRAAAHPFQGADGREAPRPVALDKGRQSGAVLEIAPDAIGWTDPVHRREGAPARFSWLG